MTPIQLHTYAEFHQYARAFAEHRLPLLIVVGSAGLGKSTALQRATEDQARVIQGQVSAFALYMDFYRYRDLPIVIDDVDRLYADPDSVRLLKLACQTEPRRTIEWNTANRHLKKEDIPKSFVTSSPVCIIANEFRAVNPNTLAIADRGITIEFSPSARELHQYVASWFDDPEILGFFGDHLDEISGPSQRTYLRAQWLKSASLNWKSMLLSTWRIDPRVEALRAVFADDRLQSTADRIREWCHLTGLDRSTFYRILGQHPEIAKLRPYRDKKRGEE